MNLTINENEGRTIVAIEGMLDTSSSQQFLDKVKSLMDEGKNDIVLEMSELVYVSSQGIRTFIAILKISSANGVKIAFRNIRPTVKEILDMSGLTQMINVE